MSAPGRIRLQLLGRFAASVVGESAWPVPIAGRQRKALLAYLAMQPQFTETRERLAALLWSESGERQARQNLRQCLLDLRRELEPAELEPLQVDRELVALKPDLVITDAGEFLALSRSDDAAGLERAMSLYRAISRRARSRRRIPRLGLRSTGALRVRGSSRVRKERVAPG